jgi:hypothetical protein
MHLRFLLVSLFLVIFIFTAKSQFILQGVVYDQVTNQPLNQIHIVNISNKNETLTDSKGEFQISSSLNNLLIFRSLGYKSDTVLVTNLKIGIHYMKADQNNLKTVDITDVSNYKDKYATTINKANAVLLVPGRGLLFYPSGYFSREGKQARKFKRMIKKEQPELVIDKRFNAKIITEILPLKLLELDAFLVLYRPSLNFALSADADDFKFYLLDAFNKFKLLPAEKKLLPRLKVK